MFDIKDFLEYDLTLKVAVIASAVLLVALIIAAVIVFVVRSRKTDGDGLFTTRDITYGAICLAISFALGFIGVTMYQGGTITPASSLAIMLFCYFFGFRKGLVVCFAFMLLQFLQSPYIVHPMSAVLDYVIPYLALIFFGVFSADRKKVSMHDGLMGAVKDNSKFLIGAACYIVIRYFSHVLSGIIFYYKSALAKGWGINAYSFAYNCFFLVDAAIAVIAGLVLLSNKSFCRFMLKEFKNDAKAVDTKAV